LSSTASAAAADISDLGEPRLHRPEPIHDGRAGAHRGSKQVLALDLVEHRQGRGRGDRVPTVGAAETADVHRIHQVGATGDRADREPATERLRARHDVGLHALLDDREPRARTPHPRLDLVGDEDDPIRVTEIGDPLDEPGGRHDEPALALDRLEDHRGDVVLPDVLVHLVERVGERFVGAPVGPAWPPVRVGERQAVDLGGERAHPLLVGHHLRGERHPQQRASVERVVERDDGRPTGRLAGDLHGVLDGLGAGIGEHRLGLAVDRRDRVEPLGELDVGLVGRDVETGVRLELRLPLDGRDHFRCRVAHVQDRDASREVDQPVAVDVFDDRAGRSGRHDRMEVGDARRHRRRAPCEPLLTLGPGYLGDQLALLWDVHGEQCPAPRRPTSGAPPAWSGSFLCTGCRNEPPSNPPEEALVAPFRTIEPWL
jgi:hypothetical protein